MIKASIRDIYHSHGGVDGYRTMQVYLRRKGTYISCATVHKYMKKNAAVFRFQKEEAGLCSWCCT